MRNANLPPNRSWMLLFVMAVQVMMLLTSGGCAVDAAAKAVRSDLKREISPLVSPAEFQEIVVGNSDFAFRLYQELRANDGNLFYSPYSISVTLAMTFAGARGVTEQEMIDTLAFSLPQDRLHPVFNALDLELGSRAEPIETFRGKQDGPELIVTNSIWGQIDHPFLPEFLDQLALNYGAGMRLVNFKNNAGAVRRTINEWVSDQTEGRIKDLVPPGVLDAFTRLVLANAIYFKADWESPFERHQTKKGPFYLLEGDQVRVPMMSQDETFRYTRGANFQVVELPYVGGEIAMDILLPDSGEFHAVESSLDVIYVAKILEDLESQRVTLIMPRFEFELGFSLSETLAKMGMPSAFSPAADFSGMDGARDLKISEVLHKAFVSVDERGTEAAAASVGFMSVVSSPPPPKIVINVDRPFIFWIRDIPTGTILFVGRVLNPSP